MQHYQGERICSASDLVHFLECEHLTALDLRALDDPALAASRCKADESAQLIARKGDQHERRYLEHLRERIDTVVDVGTSGDDLDSRVARTLAAMRDGAEVIYQATLRDGSWIGHADFLRRVPGGPSSFGTWHYEVADTKLARSPKAKFLVQLAFYSDLLAKAQGAAPRRMHVVLGDGTEQAFRFADYAHYFASLRARFTEAVDGLGSGTRNPPYPVPCDHCALCHWRTHCESRRLADDHLCQVAGITRVQTERLQQEGITTMAALAALPPGSPVPRVQPGTLARLRGQAVLQERARRTGERSLEILALDPDGRRGFHRMPPPDEGDVYFDMEGDPLEDGGLEYLFGVWFRERGAWAFRAFWALDRPQERTAFEQFMDFVAERRRGRPLSHVYHYASYEETALKRLASLHATREVELDDMLREGVLVDLYKVVREGLRISEASYSIKSVERFYRPAREGDVTSAGASIVTFERWRETGEARLLADIESYNRDDVESTQQLHDWLLGLRPLDLPWRACGAGADASDTGATNAVSDKVRQHEARLAEYRRRLVDALPADRLSWTTHQHAMELSYQLLDFHRRADKPAWWQHFSRMDMTEDELLDDPECLAGLALDPAEPPRPVDRSILYTYVAPEQETKLADGDPCTRCDTGASLGKLSFDEATRRVRLKVGAKKDPLPPRLSIGPGGPLDSTAMTNALFRFADSLVAEKGTYAATGQLLRREPPGLRGRAPGQPIVAPAPDLVPGCVEAVRLLDRSYLYVQGPPGAGKTYTGSRMIAALLADGCRVGIMSNSHKAVNHLMAGAVREAMLAGVHFSAVKKATAGRPETELDEAGVPVTNSHSNADVWRSKGQLIGGTAWLFADQAADQALDYLFVDEAGQVALANLVAAATSARNLVLLGDQMQLSQPVQGVHPGRSGDSALDYLLDGAATIEPDHGIFLATTWRMHPDVCRFISDAVYDGRLKPEEHNESRRLVLEPEAHGLLKPAGIVHASLRHDGCSQRCEAEARLVVELYESAMLQRYTDGKGAVHPMTADNILVVAPYNAQVNLLRRRLPESARVGTVDEFQGQEAELVIVSMTTSSEQDLPRHIEFLYSRNRLNVAVSRAKCLAVVVASPELMAIRCQTPEQMALVNTLCWMAEVGRGR